MGLKGAVSAVSFPAAAVMLAFAILKIAILAHYGPLQAGDTMGYQWVADAMAHDPRFWTSVPDWTTDALPTFAFRPVGYPFLLLLTRSWSIAVLLQIAMSIAVAWQMTRIVLEATKSHRLATAAAFFYLAGQTLLWDASVLSDTFYTALFNLVMLTLMRAAYRGRQLSNGAVLGLGFAWGYAIWIRENGLYLTILPLALFLFSAGIAYRRRLTRCAIFLAPVMLMVGLYAGWNHLRTGETFVGITGTPNYLRPVFEIARAGHVDPFADGSDLSKTVKATATDFGYPEQVAILETFQHETGLDPLAIQRLALHKLIDTAVRWPSAYAAVTLQNLSPARLGPVMFDPLSALNDFYQLGIPPYRRIVPGTGLKSFKELAAAHHYGGLALAASSLIAQLLATGLFLYTIARIVIGAAGAAIARRRLSPEFALALRALGIFLPVVVSFALIHSEARHLMPVVPAFLIATAVAVAHPALWRQRHRGSNSRAPHTLTVVAVLCTAFIAVCLSYHASASNLSNNLPESRPRSQEFEPPFPFNAADLWKNLAEVTNLHGPDMTRVQIERVFGIHLHPMEVRGKISSEILGVDYPKDWYYPLTFADSNKLTLFSFGWGGGVPFPHARSGICITGKTVKDTLVRQGWKPTTQERGFGIPIVEYFEYARASLNVGFDNRTGCLLSLNIVFHAQ